MRAQTFERALVGWVELARRGPIAVVLIASLATALLAVYTAGHLDMSTSTEDMLSRELSFRQRHLEFKAAFPQFTDNVLVVIDGANADLAQDAADEMAAAMRRRPDLFPLVFHPSGDRFFIEHGLLYLDPDELDDLADRLADAEPLLSDLARDPSLRGFFEVLTLAVDDILDGNEPPSGLASVFEKVSKSVDASTEGRPARLSWTELMRGDEAAADDRRRFIVAQPRLDFTSLQPAAPALEAVRDIARTWDLGAHGRIDVRVTGSAALAHEELQSVKSGAGIAGLISLCLVTVLLFLGLRSPRLVLATLLTLLVGLAWTAAFAAWAIGHLNLISVAFAVLFIGLGVDFGIHFCLRYREAVQAGADHAAGLGEAAAGVGGSLTLCTVAAAIGFLSFLPTAFVGVSELGLIAGAGMFIALFANLTLLPALLTLMPLKGGGPDGSTRVARALEYVVGRHTSTIIRGAVILGVAALAVAPLARFDVDPFNLKDPSTESVRTLLDVQRENEKPPYTIQVLAGDLDEAARLAERLEALEEVDEALILSDFVPEAQDEKLAIIDEITLLLTPVLLPGEPAPPLDEAARRVVLTAFRDALARLEASGLAGALAAPARRLEGALSRFLATAGQGGGALGDLESALVGSLPKRLDVLRRSLEATRVTVDSLPEDVRSRFVSSDGRARIEVSPAFDVRDAGLLRRFVAAVRAAAPDATGAPVIIVEAGRAVVGAFHQATVTALVLIALLLLVLLRSLRDAAYVLAPLVLAGALTVATTVVLDMPFNFANVIVLPLLLGLGVASGVHLMLRHRRAAGGEELLRTSTPRAVLFSALTTMGSFGSLALSSHRGTASMGFLLTVALAYTLVCALVVLPAMLRRRGAT